MLLDFVNVDGFCGIVCVVRLVLGCFCMFIVLDCVGLRW